MGTNWAAYCAAASAAGIVTGPPCSTCSQPVPDLPLGIEATWKPRHAECMPVGPPVERVRNP